MTLSHHGSDMAPTKCFPDLRQALLLSFFMTILFCKKSFEWTFQNAAWDEPQLENEYALSFFRND